MKLAGVSELGVFKEFCDTRDKGERVHRAVKPPLILLCYETCIAPAFEGDFNFLSLSLSPSPSA